MQRLIHLLAAVVVVVCVTSVLAQADETSECSPFMCMMECQFGFKRDAQGCEVCQCEEELCQDIKCNLGKVCKIFALNEDKTARCVDLRLPERCQLPISVGSCRAAKPRWFYNSETNSCDEFIYGGCEGNDNRFDTLADCQQACSKDDVVQTGCGEQAMCMMECPFGFKHDKFGCPVCQCAESSITVECERPLCLMFCPSGFQRDEYGCEICECAPVADKCLPIMCEMECFNGFKKDDKGCDTCECLSETPSNPLQNKCSPIMCAMYCENGFKKDKNGCDICECAPSVCPLCLMFCPFGFMKRHDGSNGCPLCACAENPCNYVDCPPGHKCKPLGRGDDYEPICIPSDSCMDIQCDLKCKNGFAFDEKGCEKCECLPSLSPNQCPMIKCKSCLFGYTKDKFGCRTCQCLPNPCSNAMCRKHEVCVVDHVQDCYVCASQSHCTDPTNVQSASINISVSFGQDVTTTDQLRILDRKLHDRLDSLNSHNNHLTNFQINNSDKSIVVITFSISKGDCHDLPAKIEHVRQMFENDWDQLSIDNGDAVNSVVAGSFDVVHYANDNVFQSQASLTHANKPTTVAVIFVAIIAIAVFIILISVAVILIRNKQKAEGGIRTIPSVSRSQYHKVKDSPILRQMT